jgi:hypothetical protein
LASGQASDSFTSKEAQFLHQKHHEVIHKWATHLTDQEKDNQLLRMIALYRQSTLSRETTVA